LQSWVTLQSLEPWLIIAPFIFSLYLFPEMFFVCDLYGSFFSALHDKQEKKCLNVSFVARCAVVRCFLVVVAGLMLMLVFMESWGYLYAQNFISSLHARKALTVNILL
jgi:hypothetical protein